MTRAGFLGTAGLAVLSWMGVPTPNKRKRRIFGKNGRSVRAV